MEHTNTAKTLKINTAVCDARHIKESTLAAYDAIEINAAFLLADSASQELLHKYPVTCNAVQTLDISGDVQVSQINGRKELGPGTPAPQSPTFLMVNGVLDIAPERRKLCRHTLAYRSTARSSARRASAACCLPSPSMVRSRLTPTTAFGSSAPWCWTGPLSCGPGRAPATLPGGGWWPWPRTLTLANWQTSR